MEGKIQKMQNKISKNFIFPNHSLSHTDHLYIYKGHIEHVGFRGHAQTMWTAMGGGGVHEMSTLLIKPI